MMETIGINRKFMDVLQNSQSEQNVEMKVADGLFPSRFEDKKE